MRATSLTESYNQAFFGGDPIPDLWLAALSSAGQNVTPDLAMMLSAFYAGVTMIATDLATMPPVMYALRPDGGKDMVAFGKTGDGGVSDLAYKLRWQPNLVQTSAEFFLAMFAQYLMREVAYAEIVSGPRGAIDQLLPRHPDRVRASRLPNGRLQYRLEEGGGAGPRFLTQDEMFVIRGLSFDGGANVMSRVAYGTQTIGTILAAERAAARFFKSGMTAAVVATYSGDLDDEEEKSLHASISRYAAGMQNTFGLMLVPDNIKVSNLAIEPEKAQMMLARQWGVAEIARLLRIPGSKLGVAGTQTYASAVQLAVDYVIGCLRPIAVLCEQAMQRDLLLDQQHAIEFNLAALMRGDPDSQAVYYSTAIKSRWMRPSEVRLEMGLNPDEELDALSAQDNRPGSSAPPSQTPAAPGIPRNAQSARMMMHSFLVLHDNAVQCVRRERAAVEKIARKHAADPEGWQAGLREFYSDQAGYIAGKMRLPMTVARGYAAEHGSALETKGVVILGDEWERDEAAVLAGLSVDFAERAA